MTKFSLKSRISILAAFLCFINYLYYPEIMSISKKNLIDILQIYEEFNIDYVIKNSPLEKEDGFFNRKFFLSKSVVDLFEKSDEMTIKNFNQKFDTLNQKENNVHNKKEIMLAALRSELSSVSLEIKDKALHTVFSDGNCYSNIMLIGEAPGENEDVEGIPFCGLSGKLLDKMLASIDLDRKSVYITNTVFWRPPGNRRPTTEELEVCKPFLEKHIAIINPEIIILVGATAALSVMNIEENISKIRGKFYTYTNQFLKKDIIATAIFHPAYLLRQPMQKKLAWEDLKQIKSFLDKKTLN